MYLFSPTSSKRAVGEAASLFTAALGSPEVDRRTLGLDLKAG